ncbi:hypothetical protein BA768_02890 [Chryseobacterium sp. CBo1]|uniref:Omp28-related outer membrane protein n=1 Tax=Chryseobacterium sp. CBo1 TaxID=1869230 RepID=UPI000810B696|nr:Omp28-related outer membrane protein [Chryseobacterium sp. CBo1]OCK51677.1 hypothetical protein BA768_02890 [Chryseobacterium sp. CBo1]
MKSILHASIRHNAEIRAYYKREKQKEKYSLLVIYSGKSTLYGGGSYIYNYVHHNVLRSRLTSSVVGDIIPGSQTVISNEYSKNFQYTIPSGYHTNNLKVIVMILNANGNVLNVREEKAGINSNYEFL